jgi:anhydro-N-acetylmuramic acid kinase
MDSEGQRAASGQVNATLRDGLVRLLRGQANAGRSLGTGDELAGWIEQHRAPHRAEDLARSACEALAIAITETINDEAESLGFDGVDRLLAAGGGVKNGALLAAIETHSPAVVQRTDDFGVPASHREAAAMAVLGALCQDEVPITLPQITGVRGPAPVAGAWIIPHRRGPAD